MTKKYEPTLYFLRNIDEEYDCFWYNGRHPLFQDVIDDLIDRCHLIRMHNKNKNVKKITDNQVMMLKLSCPIDFIIIT